MHGLSSLGSALGSMCFCPNPGRSRRPFGTGIWTPPRFGAGIMIPAGRQAIAAPVGRSCARTELGVFAAVPVQIHLARQLVLPHSELRCKKGRAFPLIDREHCAEICHIIWGLNNLKASFNFKNIRGTVRSERHYALLGAHGEVQAMGRPSSRWCGAEVQQPTPRPPSPPHRGDVGDVR